jgi:hypothetical protein
MVSYGTSRKKSPVKPPKSKVKPPPKTKVKTPRATQKPKGKR